MIVCSILWHLHFELFEPTTEGRCATLLALITEGTEPAQTMNDADIQQYRDDGYVVFSALVAGQKLISFRNILQELVVRAQTLESSRDGLHLQPDGEGNLIPGRLFKTQGVCVVEPRLLDLARDPQIVSHVGTLLGSQLHMFGSKFFPMLARGGTSTGGHQDNHYFGTNSDQIVSCGIYLEDADHSNGCLRVIPGSHHTKELVEHSFGQSDYAHGSWAEVDESRAVDVKCPAGTVVLFSANILHGTTTNTSDRSRFSTAWHYIPAELDLERFRYGEYEDRHSI